MISGKIPQITEVMDAWNFSNEPRRKFWMLGSGIHKRRSTVDKQPLPFLAVMNSEYSQLPRVPLLHPGYLPSARAAGRDPRMIYGPNCHTKVRREPAPCTESFLSPCAPGF